MAKKVELTKYLRASNRLEVCYPSTTAEIVRYTNADGDVSSVQTTLRSIESAYADLYRKYEEMYAKLCFDSVYITDSNGDILDDGSGTNLVPVY